MDYTKRFRGIAGGVHGRERAAGAAGLRRGVDAVAGGADRRVGGGEPGVTSRAPDEQSNSTDAPGEVVPGEPTNAQFPERTEHELKR